VAYNFHPICSRYNTCSPSCLPWFNSLVSCWLSAVASVCCAVPTAAQSHDDVVSKHHEERWASCFHLSPLACQSDDTDLLHRGPKDADMEFYYPHHINHGLMGSDTYTNTGPSFGQGPSFGHFEFTCSIFAQSPQNLRTYIFYITLP
jgi:hypothetical protein